MFMWSVGPRILLVARRDMDPYKGFSGGLLGPVYC